MGYKGSTEPIIPEGRIEFGPGADWKHRPCADCGGIMNIAACPDDMVFHVWQCSSCGGNNVDYVAFEASMSRDDYKPCPGFICAPYIPLDT